MKKSLQIRNSTAEFLIFTAQIAEKRIIVASGEITEESTIRKFLTTACDRKR